MQTAALTLWRWLAIQDTLEHCDLIFLSGGSIMATAEKGLELYNARLAPHIITTGNNGTFGNPDWKQPSADIFADYLIAHSVPASVITIQNTSMNTLEDATHALPLLDSQGIKHNSVILVSRPVHQRRAYATYKLQDPNAKIINAPCNELSPAELEGEALQQIAKRCVQEYERLIKYAAQGDLYEQPIPPQVKLAYEELLPHGISS